MCFIILPEGLKTAGDVFDETAAENTELFILQTPQEVRCLPHCGAAK